MLNTTNLSLKTTVNQGVSGIIQKSNQKSFFSRFHFNSDRATNLFGPKSEYDGKSVVIIQMLLITEGYILAELVYKEDF